MSSIMPVFIPVHEDPDYCPNCHLAAEKKTVDICMHCKYEYPADDEGVGCIVILLVTVGILIVIMVVKIFAK